MKISMEEALAYHIDKERTSPLRAPDWRWQVADEFAGQDEEVRETVREIDEAVFECIELHRQVAAENGKTAGEPEALRDYHQAWLLASASAHDLRRQAAGIPVADRKSGRSREQGTRVGAQILRREQLLRRWEVEARLLAEESPESIAEAVGMSPETITDFESAFFNVGDRIAATSWVNRFAIRKQRSLPMALPVDFGVVLRHFGFWNGLEVLEELLKHQVVFLDAFGELDRDDRSTEEIEEPLALIAMVQSFICELDVKRYLPMAEILSSLVRLRDFRAALQSGEITLEAVRGFGLTGE